MAVSSSLDAPKVNASSLDGGLASFRNPTGTGEVVVDHDAACSGCALREAHRICQSPPGYRISPGARLPSTAATSLRVEELWRMQAALWALSYVCHGMAQGLATPTAAEVVSVTYEVLAVEGGAVTLRGPNPRRMTVDGNDYAMPVGAQLVFLQPSVLANKLVPMITRLEMPESDEAEVEFVAHVWADVSAAMELADAADEVPETWEARVDMLGPSLAPFFARFEPDAGWEAARREVRLETIPSALNLTDSADGDSRVLYPSWPWSHGDPSEPSLRVVEERTSIGDDEKDAGWIEARLSTTQLGEGSWRSELDLSDSAGDSDVEAVRVSWWAQSTAADAYEPRAFISVGKCRFSITDPSGSYAERCGRRDSASLAASHEAGCWQPDCSEWAFALEDSPRDPEAILDLLERRDIAIELTVGSPTVSRIVPERRGPSLLGMLQDFGAALLPPASGDYKVDVRGGAFHALLVTEGAGGVEFTRVGGPSRLALPGTDTASLAGDGGLLGICLGRAVDAPRPAGVTLGRGLVDFAADYSGQSSSGVERSAAALVARTDRGPGILAVAAVDWEAVPDGDAVATEVGELLEHWF